MSLIRTSLIIVLKNIIEKVRVLEVKRNGFPYRLLLTGRDWKIFFSMTETGSETSSLPDTITISMAGSMRPLIWRKTSRIFLLVRLRATAFPIFLEAIIPNLFLSRPLGKKKTVQKFPVRCFWPWFITCSNWGLFARRSLFPNENFLMQLNS